MIGTDDFLFRGDERLSCFFHARSDLTEFSRHIQCEDDLADVMQQSSCEIISCLIPGNTEHGTEHSGRGRNCQRVEPERPHIETGHVAFGDGTNGSKPQRHIFEGVEAKVDTGMVDGGYFTRQAEVGGIDKAQDFQSENRIFFDDLDQFLLGTINVSSQLENLVHTLRESGHLVHGVHEFLFHILLHGSHTGSNRIESSPPIGLPPNQRIFCMYNNQPITGIGIIGKCLVTGEKPEWTFPHPETTPQRPFHGVTS